MAINRRNFNKLMLASVAGIMSGLQMTVSPDVRAEGSDKHACKGMNSCQAQGGCSTGDSGCAGKNSCKGHGGCETVAKHSCKGQNECKGQGGCSPGDNGCAGKNSCKGNGGCAIPVPEGHI